MYVSIDSHLSQYILKEELVNIDLSLIFESSDSESPLAKKPKLEDQDSDADDEENMYQFYEHFADVHEFYEDFSPLYFEDHPIHTKWMKQGTMIAVEKYNNLGKYPKLKLVEIKRANYRKTMYYVTFLAREEGSPVIRTYQTRVFHVALGDIHAGTQVFFIRSEPPPIKYDDDDGYEEEELDKVNTD